MCRWNLYSMQNTENKLDSFCPHAEYIYHLLRVGTNMEFEQVSSGSQHVQHKFPNQFNAKIYPLCDESILNIKIYSLPILHFGDVRGPSSSSNAHANCLENRGAIDCQHSSTTNSLWICWYIDRYSFSISVILKLLTTLKLWTLSFFFQYHGYRHL